MISLERDSHGRLYQIWKQEQANSCGVASVWMARGIARQMSFAEDEWDLATRMYRTSVAGALQALSGPSGAPRTLNPRAYAVNQDTMENTVARFGLFMDQVASALRNERLRVSTGFAGNKIIHSRISATKPAIALVSWDRRGGHFVVVGRCTASEVSFLDPWDGHVNQQRNNGRYIAKYGNQGTIVDIVYVSA